MTGKPGMQRGVRNPISNMFVNYKRKAIEREIVWELTFEEFRDLVQGLCFYCGRGPYKPNVMTNGPTLVNGIDRWNNDDGYYFYNCESCCTECNMAKGKMYGPDFIALVRRIALVWRS